MTDGNVAKLVRRVAMCAGKSAGTWKTRGEQVIDAIEASGHVNAQKMANALRAKNDATPDQICETARSFFCFPENWRTHDGVVEYIQ